MITKIRVKDFKSHRESCLEFSRGCNLLLGISGSGKSSILDAICFGLFGTTPSLTQRKIKLDDLIRNKPQEQRKAEIELEFEYKGAKYSVKRVIEKGKGTTYSEIRKEGKLMEAPSTQKVSEIIEDLLKIDFDLFSKAVYTEQDRVDLFLTIPKAQRMKKIDEMLKIEKFEEVRKIASSFSRRFEEKLKQRLQDIARMDIEGLKDKENLLKEEMANIEKSLNENEIKIRELGKELKIKEERFAELKKLKTEIDKLKIDLEKVISKMDLMKKEMEKIEEGNLEEEREKLKKVEEELEKEMKRKKVWQEEILKLRLKKKDLEGKVRELGEIEEMLKKRERIGELEQIEREEMEVRESLVKIELKREELHGIVESLERHEEASCPVCGRYLDTETKKKILEEKREELEKIPEVVKELKEKLEKIAKRKEELKKLKESIELAEKRKSSLEGCREDLENILKTLEEKEKEVFRDEELDEIAKKLRERVKELEKLNLLRSNYNELGREKMEIEKRLDEIKIDEAEYAKLEDEIGKLRIEVARLEEKSNALKKELESKKSLLKEIESQIALYNSYREEASFFDFCREKLREFGESLLKCQEEIRKEFIETLNSLMNDIWEEIYPYQDYIGIRFEVKENDYLLQLCDLRNVWVNVEGISSGGERSLACLTLRIALSLALAPNLRILILDEPTHNLDANSIEKFAEVLKTKVSDILDQIFIVTHDERFMQAVSGNVYELLREDEKRGVTKVRRL